VAADAALFQQRLHVPGEVDLRLALAEQPSIETGDDGQRDSHRDG